MNELKHYAMKLVELTLICITILGFNYVLREPVYAAEYLEVIKQDAPLHISPYKDSEILNTCQYGTVLENYGGICNNIGNSWYIVNVNGEKCYIYEGNVAEHYHNYKRLEYNGVTYEYCSCGDISVIETYSYSISRAESIAGYASAAASAAVLDGPIPVGDLVGAIILVVGACDSVFGYVSDEAIEEARSIGFDELAQTEENVCSEDSFRKVIRNGASLQYADEECMDFLEAFFYARFVGDVYNNYEIYAYELASLYGSCFNERDANKPEYWWHYHFGLESDGIMGNRYTVGYHIFYGTNGLGDVPY